MSPGFLPILGQLQSDGVHYFGNQPTALEPTWEIEGGVSRVLRLRVSAGERVLCTFVKRYQPRSGTPEEATRFRRYVVTEFTRTVLAARCGTPWAGVARPIACLPDHFALVTEEAEGVRLDRLFKRLALLRTTGALERVERALMQVGGWVRAFQADVPVVKTQIRDYRRYVDRRLQQMVVARPGFSELDRAAALVFFDSESARLEPGDLQPVPVHGDLCPSNILVRDDGVTVLDLAMSGDGARYQDLGHLFLHVELAGRRLGLGRTIVERLERALLAGFDPDLDTSSPLFRLMLLQNAVCHLAHRATGRRSAAHVLADWRSRRQVAWCLGVAGVTAAPLQRLTGA